MHTCIAPSAAVCATTVEQSRCAGKKEESRVCELAEQCVIGTEQSTNEANTDVLCDTQQEGLQQKDMQLLLSYKIETNNIRRVLHSILSLYRYIIEITSLSFVVGCLIPFTFRVH